MRIAPRAAFRAVIGLVASALCASLVSCAARPKMSRPFAPTVSCSDYVALDGDEPPFRIDTTQARPFSRRNVPWDDEDVVGLDIVWLRRPAGHSGLPEFALVVNEYSKSKGLICLVDEAGTVRTSIQDLGLIQRIRAADIAPIREPQLLIYTSPSHGTGARTGEGVLLAVSGAESRVLLNTPRYEYFALQGDNYAFGMPIVIGSKSKEVRIAFVLFQFIRRERADAMADGSYTMWAKWNYSEYEWDAALGVFRSARSPVYRCPFSPDAWTWSPDYDVEAKGYVRNRPAAAVPLGSSLASGADNSSKVPSEAEASGIGNQ